MASSSTVLSSALDTTPRVYQGHNRRNSEPFTFSDASLAPCKPVLNQAYPSSNASLTVTTYSISSGENKLIYHSHNRRNSDPFTFYDSTLASSMPFLAKAYPSSNARLEVEIKPLTSIQELILSRLANIERYGSMLSAALIRDRDQRKKEMKELFLAFPQEFQKELETLYQKEYDKKFLDKLQANKESAFSFLQEISASKWALFVCLAYLWILEIHHRGDSEPHKTLAKKLMEYNVITRKLFFQKAFHITDEELSSIDFSSESAIANALVVSEFWKQLAHKKRSFIPVLKNGQEEGFQFSPSFITNCDQKIVWEYYCQMTESLPDPRNVNLIKDHTREKRNELLEMIHKATHRLTEKTPLFPVETDYKAKAIAHWIGKYIEKHIIHHERQAWVKRFDAVKSKVELDIAIDELQTDLIANDPICKERRKLCQ